MAGVSGEAISIRAGGTGGESPALVDATLAEISGCNIS